MGQLAGAWGLCLGVCPRGIGGKRGRTKILARNCGQLANATPMGQEPPARQAGGITCDIGDYQAALMPWQTVLVETGSLE